jgi:predicted  nucleic acid-binding Zn-ribbon protein
VVAGQDGICTICHVRLRPQVFNTVLRGDEILQCDHCNRILFSTPVAKAPADTMSQPAS